MARWIWLVVSLGACTDDSGIARRVSPAPAASAHDRAPEPPGGPPSCGDVAAHLAAALAMPHEVRANAAGTEIALDGTAMRDGIVEGLAQACREGAWSLEARQCAASWRGNILRERAALRDACPGTVK